MKKRHLLTSAILAIAATTTTPAFANDPLTQVTVERVKAKSYENPKFKAWRDAGVSDEGRKNTYLAIVNEPPKDKVRKVVFISSGQQSDNVFDAKNGWGTGNYGQGYQNVLTGQPNNFKKNCEGSTRSCVRSVDARSLAARLWGESGLFDKEDTLFVMAMDMRFGYFLTTEEKQRRENAYWNFLTSKFDPSKVETMVLSGQSRGGCMMFRLGSRMRKSSKYQDIPLIVQGYDPVCNGPETPSAAEMVKYTTVLGAGVMAVRVKGIDPELPYLIKLGVKNPIKDSENKKAFLVDMNKVFPESHRDKLKVLSIHGGGKVGFPFVRAFTWFTRDTDLGWWKQKWVDIEHEEMGGNYGHAEEVGHIGYGHIYNYVRWDLPKLKQEELNRVYPTNFRAKQRFPVDVNGDKKSDIVLAYQDPVKGLIVRTKLSNGDGTFRSVEQRLGDRRCHKNNRPLMSGYFNDDINSDILILCQDKTRGLLMRVKMSNGDGTYTEKEHVAGDGAAILDLQPFVGDVNNDGLSDVILRYHNSKDGLHIRTKISNGDGTFAKHDFRAGDGNLGKYQRAHVGDVNGDRKTDLIYLFRKASTGKMEIRTRTSNGDGTYAPSKSISVDGINWENIQTFVADVNRDKKSDLIVLERKKNAELSARTFIAQSNGTFKLVTHQFSDRNEVDTLETLIADINGDLRSDIVMRVRDKNNGLMIRVKQSKGDGTYIDKEYAAGDGVQVDQTRALIGNYDDGRLADLALRFRHSRNGLYIRTKMGTSAGSFTENDYNSQDGSTFDQKEALSGTVHWSGGGTFRYGPSNPGQNQQSETAVKGFAKPIGNRPGRPSSTAVKPKVMEPAKPLKLEPKKGVLKKRLTPQKSK